MSKQLEMEESRRLYQQAQPQPVINDNRNVNAALWNATNVKLKRKKEVTLNLF